MIDSYQTEEIVALKLSYKLCATMAVPLITTIYHGIMIIFVSLFMMGVTIWRMLMFNEMILYASTRDDKTFADNGKAALQFHKSQIIKYGKYHTLLEFSNDSFKLPLYLLKYELVFIKRIRICFSLFWKSKLHLFVEGSKKHKGWFTQLELPLIIKGYKHLSTKEVIFYDSNGNKVGE